MKQFKHSFMVQSSLDKVWKFYTNINHLKIITPREMGLEITKTDHEILEEGAEAWFKARLVTNSRWHSKITHFKPYEYVDEMLSGRFKVWKHTHTFKKIDEGCTEVIDQVDFALPYGFIGKMFENYVQRQLCKIFEYRKNATINALAQKS